jgi:anti-sigma factor RsiW
MNQPCPYSEKISELIDGELQADQAKQLRQHIGKCGKCNVEFNRLQSVDQMLSGIVDIEPSSRFEPEFWKKINALKEKKKKRWLFQGIASWVFRPSFAVAAAVAAICAGIIFSVEQKPPQWNQVEFSISEDYEFYNDMDMIDQLDVLENWDGIMSMREQS